MLGAESVPALRDPHTHKRHRDFWVVAVGAEVSDGVSGRAFVESVAALQEQHAQKHTSRHDLGSGGWHSGFSDVKKKKKESIQRDRVGERGGCEWEGGGGVVKGVAQCAGRKERVPAQDVKEVFKGGLRHRPCIKV